MLTDINIYGFVFPISKEEYRIPNAIYCQFTGQIKFIEGGKMHCYVSVYIMSVCMCMSMPVLANFCKLLYGFKMQLKIKNIY